MDNRAIIHLPFDHHDAAQPDDLRSSALVEIDAAIALVAAHGARRVRLSGWPSIDLVAATGLARAQAAGVAFAVERTENAGVVTVTVGPLE